MKKIAILFVACLVLPNLIYAQEFKTNLKSKLEISKLAFLVGNWEGKGWSLGPDGQKHHFDQTEVVSFKLDSTALLIEGHGMAAGQTIHDAMAVISYKQESNDFSFTSWLANGRGGQFKASFVNDKFYWYPNENMQYVISVNEKGQWYETGEIKQGDNWFQFFEMTLDKR